MDAAIMELIEAGREKIRRGLEEEAKKERERQAVRDQAWDEYDETMRQALPESLRAYMTTNRDDNEYNLPPVARSNRVRILVPELAWFSVNVELTGDGWKMGHEFLVPTAYEDFDDEAGEYLAYLKTSYGSGEYYHDLPVTLARAQEQGELVRQYLTRADERNEEMRKRREKKAEATTPAGPSTPAGPRTLAEAMGPAPTIEERVVETLRELIQVELKEYELL